MDVFISEELHYALSDTSNPYHSLTPKILSDYFKTHQNYPKQITIFGRDEYFKEPKECDGVLRKVHMKPPPTNPNNKKWCRQVRNGIARQNLTSDIYLIYSGHPKRNEYYIIDIIFDKAHSTAGQLGDEDCLKVVQSYLDEAIKYQST